jgi:MFS family permease
VYSDARTRVVVSAAYAVQGLAFAAVLTQVPVLQDKFGFSNGQLAVILFAVPVVAGLGSVLAGLAAERVGSAVVLRIMQPVVCLAALAAGVVTSRPALYVVLAFFGLGLGAVDATMNMQGVTLQRRYGRSILAAFYAVWSAAGIAGALVSSGNEHWRLPLWAGFGLVAVVGVGTSLAIGPFLIRRAAEQNVSASAAKAPVVVPWRPIVLIGVAVTLMYVADSATSNWSADYLRRELSSGATFAAWGYAAYQACMVAGRLVADPMVRRFGSVAAVRVGAAVGTVGLLLSVLAPDAAVGIVGFGVLGLGLCVVVPESFSAAGRYDPTGSGLAVSRVNLFNYIGFLIGAPLVGAVEVVASWRIGFAVPLVLVAFIVPLAWVFRPRPVPNAQPVRDPDPEAASS